MQKIDYIFKIILIGSQNVGKSSILSRFMDDSFTDGYIATIGVDFRIQTLKIWDTAGQERFNAITSAHFKGANSCICVYDITDEKSFQQAQKYLEQLIQQYDINPSQIYLVGNKCDLEQQRKNDQLLGIQLAKHYNTCFCETSAKNNENIQQIFTLMAENLVKNAGQQQKSMGSKGVQKNNTQIDEEDEFKVKRNKQSCC